MGTLMKQSLTRHLARYEQKKAEHDAKVAQAAMDSVKKEAAKRREEALNAILQTAREVREGARGS